ALIVKYLLKKTFRGLFFLSNYHVGGIGMNWKQRFSAMAVHSLFSLVLLSFALFLVFYFWYPAPLDQAMGVTNVFWIILVIDLILGPLLTFSVFNPKKKELKIDLLIIITIQFSAYF